jgi:hypothetical protein
MKSLRSRLPGGKKKKSGIPAAEEMGTPTTSDGASPSSSTVPTPGHVKDSKRTPRSSFRERFRGDKSANKKQPTETLPENESAQPHVTTDDMQPPTHTDSFLIDRLNIDRHEDPKDQKKLEALEICIQVLDAFNKLADVIGLVMPDALGFALENITGILEKLKVRCCP